MLGHVLLNNYSVMSYYLYRNKLKHNTGRYGKVYSGIYRIPDGPERTVAIKTLKQCESENDKDEFLTEMKLMSNLIHPNIVYLFGLVQQGAHEHYKHSQHHITLQY